VGATYSLADLALTPYINRLEMLSPSGMWENRRPRLTDWFRRIKERPNYKQAVSNWISKEETEAMKSAGIECWPRVRKMLPAA
jgi:glutathione S-transferase